MPQNTTGHTEGPWIAFKNRVLSPEPQVGLAFCGESFVVGIDGSRSVSVAEAEANARLMAAAPDLFKAALAARDSAGWISMSEEEQRTILDALSKAEAR